MNRFVLDRTKTIATALLSVVLLAVFILMSLSQQKFAPVNDELANIPGGYNYLTTGRYTDTTHPPLLRYLLAVPLFIHGADPLPCHESGLYSWQGYGKDFLFQNCVPWYRILHDTRMVIILLSVALLLFVYQWAKALWGRSAAFAALAFLAFEPTFLGHGQIATLDGGFTLAFFFAVFVLWRYLVQPSWKHFLLLNLAVGIAFLTKFTAVSLFLSVPLCLFFFRKKRDLHLWRFLLSPFILLFMIWATYLFQVKSGSEDANIVVWKDNRMIQAELDKLAVSWSTTKSDLLATQLPAFDFWKGFGLQTFHALFQDLWKKQESYQYLNGEYSRRGWRTYFVWTFLYKSTLSSIALLALLTFLAVKGWGAKSRLSLVSFKNLLGLATSPPDAVAACLIISPLVLFIACSMGTINIGHRYILPIYPFLAMGAGYLMLRKERWLKYTVVSLLLAHMSSSCAVWPHHLAYFNELSRSQHHLADSNIDWGQDLLYLKTDLATPRVRATAVWGDISSLVKTSDLGMVLPPIPKAGLDSLRPGVNTVYLSVNHYLNRSGVYPQGIYPWLDAVQPVRRVGRSILVFEISQ